MIEKTNFAYDYQLLIKHLLYAPLYNNPEQEIVYRDKMRFTYKELRKRINKLANVLKGLGLEKQKTVGVMDWDSHRYLEVYFAVPMMGAVMHMINIRLAAEQVLYTINHAEDEILLIHKDFLPIYEAIKDKLTTVKHVIFITDDDDKKVPDASFCGEYETLLKSANDNFDFPDFDENTRATTFYTTGTTGLPKGVYFSHRQLVLHTFGVLSRFSATATHGRIGTDDIYMPLTPMFHVHAWGFPYIATTMGIKQVYPGRYEPSLICKLIRDEKVTFSHCVPTVLQLVFGAKEADNTDFSKMKIIIGGSAMTEKLCKTAVEKGIDIFTGYGMSETCPVLTLAHLKPQMLNLPIEKQVEIRCKTGLPLPLTYINLMSEDGNFLPKDGKTIGEVVVRSPWLTMGYYKEKERAEELWRGNWLHTGDLGYFDEEGYLKIVDRAKDVIKTGGEWISSLDIENIIISHESVMETAVIGIPDEKWGERPMALIVLKEGYKGKVSSDDIKRFLEKFVENKTISKWAIPDRIEFVESIPKTSVGKLDKKVMRKMYIGA